MPPSSISWAAHIPVSSEISALYRSTGNVVRSASTQPPDASWLTDCSGRSRLIACRVRASASRARPTSGSAAMGSGSALRSMATCTPS